MPSAALRLQGVQPVEPHEVVEALADRLRGSDRLSAIVGLGDATAAPGRVHAHNLPLRADGGDSEAASAPVWVLVAEFGDGRPGGGAENPPGLTGLTVQVQVNLDPRHPDVRDPYATVGQAHVRAWEALQGALLDVARGRGRFVSTAQVSRTKRPSPARYDRDGRLYSSAYYVASVRPVSP